MSCKRLICVYLYICCNLLIEKTTCWLTIWSRPSDINDHNYHECCYYYQQQAVFHHDDFALKVSINQLDLRCNVHQGWRHPRLDIKVYFHRGLISLTLVMWLFLNRKPPKSSNLNRLLKVNLAHGLRNHQSWISGQVDPKSNQPWVPHGLRTPGVNHCHSMAGSATVGLRQLQPTAWPW